MKFDWEKVIEKAFIELKSPTTYTCAINLAQNFGDKWYIPRFGPDTLAYFIEAVESELSGDSERLDDK